jgi:C_GCAxxG_C_C family probable redox protein
LTKQDILAERAATLFRESYNCAQSVLLTMFEHWNMKNELVPKIATPFGGGIGMCGSLCGALMGGVMAIGVKHGTNEPSYEKRQKAYTVASKFYKRFEREHGSVCCRELTGYDLTNPEEIEKARDARVFETKCTDIVKSVVVALTEVV